MQKGSHWCPIFSFLLCTAAYHNRMQLNRFYFTTHTFLFSTFPYVVLYCIIFQDIVILRLRNNINILSIIAEYRCQTNIIIQMQRTCILYELCVNLGISSLVCITSLSIFCCSIVARKTCYHRQLSLPKKG